VRRVVLASDFHLSPDQPAVIDVFVRFVREVVSGADRFYVLGDLFEFWIGRRQLGVEGYEPVWDALSTLSATGTEVVMFHGNRDFLLGAPEAKRSGGRVTGEEEPAELFDRRYLLLHGDSLCTRDQKYQDSKPLLRGWIPKFLSWALPRPAALAVARRVRKTSTKSVGARPREEMEIVGEAVRERFLEGYDSLICGHVHAPGEREYGEEGGAPAPVLVLGDWSESGGVYGEIDASGPRLITFRS